MRSRPWGQTKVGRSIAVVAWLAMTATVALVPDPASSAEAARVKIVGLGAAACKEFVDEIAGKPFLKRNYLSWAQGFMSGF